MTKKQEQLKELRAMKEEQLQKQLQELRDKVRDLSFGVKGDEVKDLHILTKTRKEIARVLTVLNEKSNINQVKS